MKTVVEHTEAELEALHDRLHELLMRHVKLEEAIPFDSFLITATPNGFTNITDQGKRMQAQLEEHFDRLAPILIALFRGRSVAVRQTIDNALERILRVIDLERTGWATISAVLKGVNSDVDDIRLALRGLSGELSGEYLVVPDTNALLFQPDIELWAFDGMLCAATENPCG